jgi:hypothetical protein
MKEKAVDAYEKALKKSPEKKEKIIDKLKKTKEEL